MLETIEAMEAHMRQLGLTFKTVRHPPVFTVDEAALHTDHLPGGHTKNLFLKDRAGAFMLVTALARQPVKINGLARMLSAGRLSFAGADELFEVLGVRPGSVTPLALVNAPPERVRVVWDRNLMDHAIVNVHPLCNVATTALAPDGLMRLVRASGHDPELVDLDLSLDA